MKEPKAKKRTGVAKIEERKHPRFLLNLPIEYARVDSDARQTGYTFNTSEGGLMVNLPENLEAGQLLKIRVFFSWGMDISSIEILCQIVWTDHAPGDEGYRSGVKFLEFSEGDLNKLILFIKKLVK
jgi:c-di-GMP-binding flagellar brake protein YcgR